MTIKGAAKKIIHMGLYPASTLKRIIFGSPDMCVLLYHKIEKPNPASITNYLCTSPRLFERQIKYLVRKRLVLDPKNIAAMFNGRKGVLITFDDGTPDFVKNALPILEKYRVPVVMFISGSLWWEDLEEIILKKSEVKMPNSDRVVKTSTHREKRKVYEELVKICYSLDSGDAIKKIITSLNDGKPVMPRALRPDEWKKIVEHEFITIGGHTENHPNLTKLSPKEIEYEIAESKRLTEKKVKKELELFAYPSGFYNSSTIGMLRDAGYKLAFIVGRSKEPSPYTISRAAISESDGWMGFINKLYGVWPR